MVVTGTFQSPGGINPLLAVSNNLGWSFLLVPVPEHDPEKACPALDAGWLPVFRKDHAQTIKIMLKP